MYFGRFFQNLGRNPHFWLFFKFGQGSIPLYERSTSLIQAQPGANCLVKGATNDYRMFCFRLETETRDRSGPKLVRSQSEVRSGPKLVRSRSEVSPKSDPVRSRCEVRSGPKSVRSPIRSEVGPKSDPILAAVVTSGCFNAFRPRPHSLI